MLCCEGETGGVENGVEVREHGSERIFPEGVLVVCREFKNLEEVEDLENDF